MYHILYIYNDNYKYQIKNKWYSLISFILYNIRLLNFGDLRLIKCQFDNFLILYSFKNI